METNTTDDEPTTLATEVTIREVGLRWTETDEDGEPCEPYWNLALRPWESAWDLTPEQHRALNNGVW